MGGSDGGEVVVHRGPHFTCCWEAHWFIVFTSSCVASVSTVRWHQGRLQVLLWAYKHCPGGWSGVGVVCEQLLAI